MRCFEFEVTYRCNTVCTYCNRLLGLIHLPDSDLTMEQVKYACDRLEANGYLPHKIKMSGGEPRCHPQLDEIRSYIAKRLKPRRLWTLTNGLEDTKKVPVIPIKKIEDAGNHVWHRNPLPKQNHDPFLISPVDVGMDQHAEIEKCTIQSRCGRAFDAHGFSFCPLAPMLGRILRINPYTPDLNHEKNHEICRHCPHSIPEGPRQQELFQIAIDGKYPSKTHLEGLKKYKQDPIIFPRLQVESFNETPDQTVDAVETTTHVAGMPVCDGTVASAGARDRR